MDDGVAVWGRDFGGQVSSAWERYRDRVFHDWLATSEWLVDSIGPRPGQVVLELAAGPGETGFLAAERLLPGGRLISTDLADGMVAAADRGAAARGLTNVECRTMDAQAIDLADASVDGVLSRFGLMLVPDPGRAFAEAHRVLRGGGCLAYSVFSTPERNPWLMLLIRALAEHGHTTQGGDAFGPGGPFSLADTETNQTMLHVAGFEGITIEEIRGARHYDSLDDYWEMQTALGGPLAAQVARLTSDEHAGVKATLSGLAASFERDGAYDLPYVALGVSARKPSG